MQVDEEEEGTPADLVVTGSPPVAKSLQLSSNGFQRNIRQKDFQNIATTHSVAL